MDSLDPIDPTVTFEDGWEAHRRQQLAGNLRSTPLERLRWLEAAIEFAHRAGALPRPDESPAITTRDKE